MLDTVGHVFVLFFGLRVHALFSLLSVPVQLIAWEDSSLKFIVMCRVGR